ncbi:MFS transporter [Candidatus Gottesmanbacteria bacterium]|nr:MFS transporter [Candidatus Gottesmanbacteria bacterium]
MPIAKNIKLLSLLNFCTDFVFFAPVAILYFAQVTGSYALGMSIFSLAYVSSAIIEVPTGIVSDLVGRKKTTILGAASSVLCVTLYAIGGSYWWLAAGALLQGLSRAFYSGNNDALLHDTLREIGKENEYHTYLGKTSSMFQIALAAASLMGGFMASQSYSLVMWASVIPQIGALVIAIKLVEPSINSRSNTNMFAHIREALGEFKKNYRLRLLTLASSMRFGLGESGYFLRSAFISTLWPLWAIGVASALSNVGAAWSYFYGGRLIDKFRPLRVLNIEIISNRIVNLTALFFPTVVSPILMNSTSLFFGAGSVAMNSLLQKEFTQAQRATMSSLNAFAGGIVFGIASIILGVLADRFDARTALIITNLVLLIPLFFYRKIFLHERVNGGRIETS